MRVTDRQLEPIFSCENPVTLQGYLKDTLNFSGFVVTDWGAAHSASLRQGLDWCPTGSTFPENKIPPNSTGPWHFPATHGNLMPCKKVPPAAQGQAGTNTASLSLSLSLSALRPVSCFAKTDHIRSIEMRKFAGCTYASGPLFPYTHNASAPETLVLAVDGELFRIPLLGDVPNATALAAFLQQSALRRHATITVEIPVGGTNKAYPYGAVGLTLQGTGSGR